MTPPQTSTGAEGGGYWLAPLWYALGFTTGAMIHQVYIEWCLDNLRW